MSKIIKGRNVNLLLAGSPVATSTSCQLSVTANTADAAAKSDPGDGMFDNPEFTNASWTCSNESFVTSMSDLQRMLETVINGTATYDVSFEWAGQTYKGSAIVTQLQLSSPNGDFAKLTLSLEGNGPLTAGTSSIVLSTYTTSRIKGKAFMVAVYEASVYHTIVASTSHTLTVNVQTSEISTKDDPANASFKEVTGKSVSLSTDNLLSTSTASDETGIFFPRLMSAATTGEELTLQFGYYGSKVDIATGSDKDYGDVGSDSVIISGTFLCTRVNVTGAVKDNATYSAEFTNKGQVTVGV